MPSPVLPVIEAFDMPMPYIEAPSGTKFIDRTSPIRAKMALHSIGLNCQAELKLDDSPFVEIGENPNQLDFFWDDSNNPEVHFVVGGGQIIFTEGRKPKLSWIWLNPPLRGKLRYVYNFADYYLYKFNTSVSTL